MAKKDRVMLPPTGGGLFRTFEGEGTGLKIKPEHIVGASIGVVIFEVLLHLYGGALF